MNTTGLLNFIKDGGLDARLAEIYGSDKIAYQKKRYEEAAEEFLSIYGEREVSLFSVPGRSEISGNHTDHNHGKVLAGSIDLDIIAVASKTDDGTVRIKSKGFDEDVVVLDEYKEPRECHKFKSVSLVAGMARAFSDASLKTGGYVAYTTSDVFKGSGLSSSAAFEVMVGNIFNYLYNDGKADNADIAKMAQFAENRFFGKPCGLMDQTACAVGGVVYIDFKDTSRPEIKKIDFDLTGAGYSLCIVDTGGNHADLNEDYASVPAEMKSVAKFFGKEVLREIEKSDVLSHIKELREAVGDRAILRSLHFFDENVRVEKQANALISGDIKTFFEYVLKSGNSSFKYLQNVYTVKNVSEQGLSLALCLAESVLADVGGAFRVHGGGFAGTTQAFVPTEYTEKYKKVMDEAFGEGACHVLRIRADGAIKVL